MVNVRGVEIEVIQVGASEARAEMTVAPPGVGWKADEGSVRAACAGALSEALMKRVVSLALPAYGTDSGDFPLVASAKIHAQEAIRIARGRPSSLRRIVIYFPGKEGFETFSRALRGYIEHFLEVLSWGPLATVDAIIEVRQGIVLVERSNPPFGYALPGGFVDYGESLEDAVRREAREETGLELLDLRQFHTYSEPARDPRFHTVTTVFNARAGGFPRAGDDAADIRVVKPDEIAGLAFAFDHRQVLADYLGRRWQ
jgi:ADP-ribose pyrophosphatase YjhB (NUDIX family)